jgi:hypothetical protein
MRSSCSDVVSCRDACLLNHIDAKRWSEIHFVCILTRDPCHDEIGANIRNVISISHNWKDLCDHLKSLSMYIYKIRTSHYLVMVIGSACLLIFWRDVEVHPLVFIVECRVVIDIWRCSPISFKHVSLCSLILTEPQFNQI